MNKAQLHNLIKNGVSPDEIDEIEAETLEILESERRVDDEEY